MAETTGPVILAGAIAAANEAFFAPLSTGKTPAPATVFRLVPATVGLALALALLERAVPEFAKGLAWLLVLGVLVFPVGHAPTPLDSATKILKL